MLPWSIWIHPRRSPNARDRTFFKPVQLYLQLPDLTIYSSSFNASSASSCRVLVQTARGIGDNGIWLIAKLNGILYLLDVGSKTRSFSSAFAGIFASN